jgi:hypothetical protein
VIAGIVTSGKPWRGSFRGVATDLIPYLIAGVTGRGPTGCTGIGIGDNRRGQGGGQGEDEGEVHGFGLCSNFDETKVLFGS